MNIKYTFYGLVNKNINILKVGLLFFAFFFDIGRGEVPNDSNFSWDFLYNKYPPGKRVCIAIFPYIGQHMRFWTYRILSHYTYCTNVPFNNMQWGFNSNGYCDSCGNCDFSK